MCHGNEIPSARICSAFSARALYNILKYVLRLMANTSNRHIKSRRKLKNNLSTSIYRSELGMKRLAEMGQGIVAEYRIVMTLPIQKSQPIKWQLIRVGKNWCGELAVCWVGIGNIEETPETAHGEAAKFGKWHELFALGGCGGRLAWGGRR